MLFDTVPFDLTSVGTALVAGALLIVALSKFPKIRGRAQRDRRRSHRESEIIPMRWVKLANGDGSLVARSSLSKEVNEDIMLSRASFSSNITTVPDYDHPDESNLPSMRTAFVAGLLLIVTISILLDGGKNVCQEGTSASKIFDKHWGADESTLKMRDKLRSFGKGSSGSQSFEQKRPPIFLMPGLASTR